MTTLTHVHNFWYCPSRCSAELHGQISKIDLFRNRYEILTMSMHPPEGEEQHSQTYYVIKAAQERDELERQGNALHNKIGKAENEIA